MGYIQLKEVTFQYPNGFVAIDNISMNIEKGETVAIIGQNGAGKTTTVKLMNGLMKPAKGDVIVGDWNTKEHTTAEISRKVGYVFQNPDDQIFHNDVYSEIEFGPKKLGFTKEKVKENVIKAAELANVSGFLDENPYNLPFSTRKFVTIASVIAMDTDVLIFDEPTAGQDMVGMNTLTKLIKELKNEGKTIITITHDMEFVINNFERVIVMAHKNILEDNDKREVFWNHSILKEAMLKQSFISDLAYTSNINHKVLDVNEMVQYYLEKRQ